MREGLVGKVDSQSTKFLRRRAGGRLRQPLANALVYAFRSKKSVLALSYLFLSHSISSVSSLARALSPPLSRTRSLFLSPALFHPYTTSKLLQLFLVRVLQLLLHGIPDYWSTTKTENKRPQDGISAIELLHDI